MLKRDQRRADGDPVETAARFANVCQRNDVKTPSRKNMEYDLSCPLTYISRITGMIKGRFWVCLEMNRFRSARIFSLITP